MGIRLAWAASGLFHNGVERAIPTVNEPKSGPIRHESLSPELLVQIRAVFDVAVDIRKSSPTFGRWVGMTLSAESKQMLWIPAGFAHGFLVLSDSADFLYKTTDYWYPEHERTLLWNDPALGIVWPVAGAPTLAAKDAAGLALAQAELFP